MIKYPEYAAYVRKDWGKDSQGIQMDQSESNGYIPNMLRHWTEDIYDILKFLEQMEEEEPQGYIDLWLRTRLNRAKNNRIDGIEETEIKRIEHACERLRSIRQEEKNNNKTGMEI